MGLYIVEIQKDMWLAPWDGDPGRTLVKANAKWFSKKSAAWMAVEAAQAYRPFKNAQVLEGDK